MATRLLSAAGATRNGAGCGRSWRVPVGAAALAFLVAGILGARAADPLAAWHPAELEWQLAFQGSGRWGLAMRAVSALGPGPVLAALLGALYFGDDPRRATRLSVLVFLGLWLREWLAVGLQSPRPYWIEPALQTFGDSAVRSGRFGLPSGHALVAAAFWFRVAMEFRERRGAAWAVAGCLVLAIGVSRVYLGVHFVSDVVAGTVVGTLLGLASRRVEAPFEAWWREGTRAGRAWVSLGAGLALALAGVAMHRWTEAGPPPGAWAEFGRRARTLEIFFELGGTISGVGLGVAWLRGWIGGGDWRRRVLRIGVAGVVAKWGLREPLSLLVDGMTSGAPAGVRWSAEFGAGVLQGALVWGVLPWLFLRLGWAVPLEDPRAGAWRPDGG